MILCLHHIFSPNLSQEMGDLFVYPLTPQKQNSLLNVGILPKFTSISHWNAGSIEGTLPPLPRRMNTLFWKHTQCWHKPDSSRDENPIFCWIDSALTTTLKPLHNVFLSIWVLSPLQKIYTERWKEFSFQIVSWICPLCSSSDLIFELILKILIM